MDILSATTQAKPQYGIIINVSDVMLPLEVHGRTELEIGFGNGEYTVQYAELHPETFFYGVEISQSCVLKCARRAAGLQNLRIINTDARFMLRELFTDKSLDRILMQFPCPWSKNSDAHRRVTAKDFSDGLAAVLKVSGIFEMLTDDEAYSLEVRDVLGSHEALELCGYEVNPSRTITTKYERKWLEEGKNIYMLTFRKTQPFTAGRRTSQDMHIKIKHDVTAEDIASLRNVSGKDEKSFWKFGRCFTGESAYLLETLTSDDEFEQKFYIHIAPRDDGYFLLRLDKSANAFLTPAVRGALNDAAQRLAHTA